MTWGAAVLGALSAVWSSWKAWRAERAAVELQPGQAVVDAMKKDTEEIDRLAEGTNTP